MHFSTIVVGMLALATTTKAHPVPKDDDHKAFPKFLAHASNNEAHYRGFQVLPRSADPRHGPFRVEDIKAQDIPTAKAKEGVHVREAEQMVAPPNPHPHHSGPHHFKPHHSKPPRSEPYHSEHEGYVTKHPLSEKEGDKRPVAHDYKPFRGPFADMVV